MGSCRDGFILNVPNTSMVIESGNHVKLNRFATQEWIVQYGWFSFGGNRPFCGWYLITPDGEHVKPLQLTDLDDIYIIEK